MFFAHATSTILIVLGIFHEENVVFIFLWPFSFLVFLVSLSVSSMELALSLSLEKIVNIDLSDAEKQHMQQSAAGVTKTNGSKGILLVHYKTVVVHGDA